MHQIKTAMQTGIEHGMRTLNQSLLELYRNGRITEETAFLYSEEKANIQEDLQRNAPGNGPSALS